VLRVISNYFQRKVSGTVILALQSIYTEQQFKCLCFFTRDTKEAKKLFLKPTVISTSSKTLSQEQNQLLAFSLNAVQ